MAGMPTTQQSLLAQAITAVNNWRTAAQGVTGGPVDLLQVNFRFPPPAGDPSANKTSVVFVWDEEAEEFRVDT